MGEEIQEPKRQTKSSPRKFMKTKQFKEIAKQLGQRGGQATLKKYGKKHFKEIRKSKAEK